VYVRKGLVHGGLCFVCVRETLLGPSIWIQTCFIGEFVNFVVQLTGNVFEIVHSEGAIGDVKIYI
jgi:hypothetical protein